MGHCLTKSLSHQDHNKVTPFHHIACNVSSVLLLRIFRIEVSGSNDSQSVTIASTKDSKCRSTDGDVTRFVLSVEAASANHSKVTICCTGRLQMQGGGKDSSCDDMLSAIRPERRRGLATKRSGISGSISFLPLFFFFDARQIMVEINTIVHYFVISDMSKKHDN
jgi:hypothetical protein